MTPPHNAYYFHHIDELGFRLDRVRRSGPVHPLVTGAGVVPVMTYRATDGRDLDVEQYFIRNRVTGFLVLRGDTVLLERYFHGAGPRSRFVSQSVGKSILSILVGAAVEAGKLRSIDDPVTAYLPELATSGYRDATVKNVLQMATGVDYSEDYRDSTSGAASIGKALITGRPAFGEFVRSMKPTEVPPGTAFEYQSVNSQLLGQLVERATGMPLNGWAERSLWNKVGAESDAFFYRAKDQPDVCAFACYNATLRDYGRVGLLMLGKGKIGGRRVVSEAWVDRSVTPDAKYLEPGLRTASGRPRMGYGFQWWIPPGEDGAFMAIGIFGQAIYVNPARRVVIVQTAAWPDPIGIEGHGAERQEMFAAIAPGGGAIAGIQVQAPTAVGSCSPVLSVRPSDSPDHPTSPPCRKLRFFAAFAASRSCSVAVLGALVLAARPQAPRLRDPAGRVRLRLQVDRAGVASIEFLNSAGVVTKRY